MTLTNLTIDGKQLTSASQMPTSTHTHSALNLRTKTITRTSPNPKTQPQIEVHGTDLPGPINIPFINVVNVNVHKVPNAQI